MSSSNFLTVKTLLSGFKNNTDKDTLSEASESGTSNSVTSAEDLQKLAVILGLNSAEDVYQERFRVDRRRLEAMLAENLEESQTAQAFFHRVMTETNTLVNWPARLKIGARSKKDPHVRVAGRPDDVKLAREKIMQLLDTRNNRVTMKIDVSYTDHSHIIGKGGLTIKRVMEETGCHIHFPDSNRTSAAEKSNQVSIAGDMERVERARARVRALTPLIFSFELPVVPASQPLPDVSCPAVQQIQEQYNVQVMVRNRSKLHANLVVVKGVQWEVRNAMEATTRLMDVMCGPLASQTHVQMTLEITPAHHSAVVGPRSEQLRAIVRGTGAQVMFPDATDPNTPPLKKSCVTITGAIKDVYAARQQLVGSLPLVVIFDVGEDTCRVDSELANRLMHQYNVYINLRRKPKQGICSVVIKGIERCAGDIYEARRELLGGREPAITAEIPESYTIPSPSPRPLNIFSLFAPANNSPMPYTLPLPELSYNMGSPMYNTPPTPGGYPTPVSPSPMMTPPIFPWAIPSPQPRAGQFHYPMVPNHNSAVYTNGAGSWNPMSPSTSAAADLQHSMMMYQQQQQPPEQQPQRQHHQQQQAPRPSSLSQILNSSGAASSGYQSNFTGSTVSLDNITSGSAHGEHMASPSVSPISKNSSAPTNDSDTSHQGNDITGAELATLIQDLSLSDRRAPGCEKKTLETALSKISPLSDYRHMKSEASKAMRESVGGGLRVPTPRWAGYYFSNTSPGAMNLSENLAKSEGMATPDKRWNKSELTRPNIAPPPPSPATPAQPLPGPSSGKPCRYQQLYDLLKDIGLQKYIDLFKRHELDMATFVSLSETDLAEIGVTAFGARRKMLLIIAELQKQASSKGSPSGAGPSTGNRKLIQSPPYNPDALNKDKW